jgi:hypothetical protein
MRPILALTILLLGLRGAAPEPKILDSLVDAVANTSSSPLTFEPAIAKTDREFIWAVSSLEWSEDGHEQEALSPQSVAAASVDRQSDDVDPPSLDDLCTALLTSAQDNDLPVPFFANLIWQESRFQYDAMSPVGALGIAQFMPKVAAEAGLGDPFDPRQAIPASARFLRGLRAHFGNLGFVAAAYNAGAHRVNEWLTHRRVLPRETRTYVVRVTGRSVEEWRKAPVADAELSFAHLLPCRELPPFADLEQAQESLLAQSKPEQVASEMAKTALGVHRRLADREHAHRRARSDTANKIARDFHGGRREATRQHRTPRERRRIASGEGDYCSRCANASAMNWCVSA